MVKTRDMLKVAFVYVGTVLGAGFSSGQEVMTYFLQYRGYALLGIIVSGILFCLLAAWILSIVYDYNVKGFDEFTQLVFGKRFGKMVGIFITVFMFCGFCAMVSGSGAVLKEQFGVSPYLGMAVMLLLSFIIFSLGLKGILNTNVILTPLMLIGIVCIGVIGVSGGAVETVQTEGVRAAGSGTIYASYNMLTAMVMLVAAGREMKDKKTAQAGGILGGVILFICLFSLYAVMNRYYDSISLSEIPMLRIAAMIGTGWNIIYIGIIYSAMLTTAIACGYGVLEKVNLNGRGAKYLAAGALCVFSIPLASLGFAKIVGVVYSSFGYIGILVMIKMIINAVKERKLKEINKKRIKQRINEHNSG